ncbi:pseudouridine synthase, partial [Pseudomonas sp. FW305-BF6]
AIIRLVIHEGRNRQVKRMLEAIGTPVMKLKRERYAFLDLSGLTAGDARELSPHEVKQLRAMASAKPR